MTVIECNTGIVESMSGHYHSGLEDSHLHVLEEHYRFLVAVSDELAAYRIRKEWQHLLAHIVSLESECGDIKLRIEQQEDYSYTVTCDFLSPQARFTFWRVATGRAPALSERFENAASGCKMSTCQQKKSGSLDYIHTDACRDEGLSLYLAGNARSYSDLLAGFMKNLLSRIW